MQLAIPQEKTKKYTAFCRTIPANYISLSAPFKWVRMGIEDFFNAPKLSLYFGLFFVTALALLLLVTITTDYLFPIFLIIPLLVLIGPQIAYLLYDISRQLQRFHTPSLIHALQSLQRNKTQQWAFALMLLILSLFWIRMVSILFALFPNTHTPALAELLPFFFIGTLIGALFSFTLFAISAFTLPLLLERHVDLMTAISTSVNAVWTNKAAMLIWASLIVLALLIGLLTGLVGLAVTMPIIGFSAWHGYQETILTTVHRKGEPLDHMIP